MSKIYQKIISLLKKSAKRNLNGFTLIELLVVVLIIGILAAIALPQYEKAVEKSRAGQVLSLLRSVGDANQRYYMANGKYAEKFDDLDVTVPWTGTDKYFNNSSDVRSDGEWSVQLVDANRNVGVEGVYLGRLTGKYKGGGFAFLGKNTSGIANGSVICVERTCCGVLFEGSRGDYCTKVIGATYAGPLGGVNAFYLP